jgi:PUA-domain protein
LPAKRHLKDKETKQVLREFTQRYPTSGPILLSASDVEEQVVGKGQVFFFDGRALMLRTAGGGLIPSLKFDELLGSLPKVVVDMGAVAHIANGAHIMRPGISEIQSDFKSGDLLLIVDQKFGKNIALGIADTDSNAMKSMDKGKVVTNVHYVGDDFWKSFTSS